MLNFTPPFALKSVVDKELGNPQRGILPGRARNLFARYDERLTAPLIHDITGGGKCGAVFGIEYMRATRGF